MKKVWILFVVLNLILLSGYNDLNGQTNSYLIEEVTITITGTSTLHDWKVSANEVDDYPNELTYNLSEGGSIDKFGFKVAVNAMDGGRGSSMNQKIFKALKSDQYPYVTFSQLEPTSYAPVSEESFQLESKGVVDIAGSSIEQVILVNVISNIDTLILEGHQAMKLSDYGIDPPSAMFGQIQTKNDIVVHFQFVYKKKG